MPDTVTPTRPDAPPHVIFTNLTRSNEIGANSYLIESGGKRVLVDAGLHPRLKGIEATPNFSLIEDKKLDGFLVTHAHLDHLGAVPIAMRDRDMRLFMTQGTYTIADQLLHNSANVMKRQAEDAREGERVLFTHADVDRVSRRWRAVPERMPCNLESRSAQGDDFAFEFIDAGHVLGAAGIRFRHQGRSVFYTGDVSFTEQTISPGADFPTDGFDTLVIETTRGAQPTPEGYTRENELLRLADAIRETFEAGGTVLMPVFALGKTQEALAFLDLMMSRGLIPESTIYITGMSWKLSQLHDDLAGSVRRNNPGIHLIPGVAPELFTGRSLDGFRPRRKQIYLLTSGMMTEHTLSNKVAQMLLPHERHAILFIGYCDPNSPAGRLRAAVKDKQPAILDDHVGPQEVKCRVEHFDLTAHALREDLLDFILKSNPAHCVLVHGDTPALEWFSATLAEKAPHMRVTIPPAGQPVEL